MPSGPAQCRDETDGHPRVRAAGNAAPASRPTPPKSPGVNSRARGSVSSPGKFDAEVFLDGKAFRSDGKSVAGDRRLPGEALMSRLIPGLPPRQRAAPFRHVPLGSEAAIRSAKN